MQPPVRHVELDHVAVSHHRQRPAARRLGRGVQHDRAIGGAGHARVGDAHHVGDALAQHLRRQAHVADLGHARIALRPAVLQDHDAGLVDVERFVVDLGLVVVDVLEDDGPARCTIRCGEAADGFSTAPLGARLPRSTAMPPDRGQRLLGRPDHVLVPVATSLTSSQIGPPETVSASLCRRPASPSALITTGRPPA